MGERVREVLGKGRIFGAAPFFRPDSWTYIADCQAFPVAGSWPDELLTALGAKDARTAAAEANASEILLTMRNALAHGGITSLDRNGGHTYADRLKTMLAAAEQIRTGSRT